MTIEELSAIIKGLAPVFHERLVATRAAFEVRMIALEAQWEGYRRDWRQPKDGEKGEKGDTGPAGKDADISLIESARADILAQFAALPVPKDGEKGDKGDPGEPGKDAEVSAVLKFQIEALQSRITDLELQLRDTVREHIEAIDLKFQINQEITRALATLPVPKDGRDGDSVMDGLIDRDGHLILVLSNGTWKDLGIVVGRDADPAQTAALVQAEVAKLPPARDGRNGIDGRDGLGFDDVETTYDGERTITIGFRRGEIVKAFPLILPFVIDRGVYRDDAIYQRGDGVTRRGSFWIAQEDTMHVTPGAEPGGEPRAWRLAVKSGVDGKTGPAGPPGPKGADGRHGKDYTQMGPDGRKW